MTNFKSTKRALLMSGLALFVCISMFVGSTFAWFTDSVTSSGNKIQAGTLQIDLSVLDDGKWRSIKKDRNPLFENDTLWEPGYTEVKVLKIENTGNLALKWFAKFTAQKALSDLAKVIDVYVLPSTTELAMPADRDLTGYTNVGTLDKFINTIEQTTTGILTVENKEAYLGIALKMQETAGNEYQGLDLGGEFDITIFATQYTDESDSFGIDYDAEAKFDVVYDAVATFEEGASAVEVTVRRDPKSKLTTVLVPAAAVADVEDGVKVTVTPQAADSNIVIAANEEAKSFDIKVLGLKENNEELLTLTLNIPTGLDPTTVKLYHYEKEIDCSYDPTTGVVTFQTATFSPFTVVYDVESEYVAPPVSEDKAPVAKVEPYTLPEKITWGSFGQWSPTVGLEANLEVAYTFSCTETAAEASMNPYADWYCDFYVELDKDLGPNQIFLGGNYGSFGWVGFHNGDLTVEANNPIGILEGVTTKPWTYRDVASYVGTFICGVGDVDDALSGATFTVTLRLTNPENEKDFINVASIPYTFN